MQTCFNPEDIYREASFRGIPFLAKDSDTNIGRRGTLHEYPYRDVPYFEDMGRKAREFSITARLSGDQHVKLAEDLTKAIETAGEGTLVHPQMGEVRVYCVNASRKDSDERMGITEFNLDFVEAGKYLYPLPIINSRSILDSTVSASISSIITSIDNALGLLYTSFATVNSIRNSIILFTNQVVGVSSSILSFARSSLQVARYANLAQLISDSIQEIIDSAQNTESALESMFSLRGFSSAIPPTVTTPQTTAAYNAQLTFDRLVNTIAAINAAKLSSSLDYESTTRAIEIRDNIRDWLDDVAITSANALDDVSYVDILKSRSAFLLNMNNTLAVLPTFVRFMYAESFPSVVLGHRIFQDYTRESDLRRWNCVFSPLFMPLEIEALR